MDIHVYSNSVRIRTCFDAVERSRKHTVTFLRCDEIDGWLKNGKSKALVYVDIAGMGDRERAALLRRLARSNGRPFAVVDPRGAITDPAVLFRGGALDYVNRSLYSEGVPVKRIDEVAEYLRMVYPEQADVEQESNGQPKCAKPRRKSAYRLSGDDWSEVQPDREYTFAILFAELDNTGEYEAKTSHSYTASVSDSFRQLLEREIAPSHGRLWMWRDFGGVMLFPFNGRSCPALVPCVRLVLNRPLDNVVSFDLNSTLSFRLSLHLGNTVYRHKGETGEIVSDSVNFIHHLGQKFTPPSNFTITGEVLKLIPNGLKELFVPLGEFEHRLVYRMRLPTKPLR